MMKSHAPDAYQNRALPSFGFRMQLCFKVKNNLMLDTTEHRFFAGGCEVTLSSGTRELPIKDSNWLMMSARGFATLEDARDFGAGLRFAIDLASIATRLGVDTGIDTATSGVGEFIRDIASQKGLLIRDRIHGIDVHEDDPRICVFSMEARCDALASHEPFLSFATDLFESRQPLSKQSQNIIILLNSALMLKESIGQIVFAVSAVEMIGQDLDWTTNQKNVLQKLAAAAQTHMDLTPSERIEVSSAIQKLHRISLRQGVFRLLDRLELSHFKRRWGKLYEQRSALIHATSPQRDANYDELAIQTMTLCGFILLKAIAAEFPLAGRFADRYFKPM